VAQTSILGRIGQLARANINALLDSAEDPEKMLDQLVRDFRENIAEAEQSVARTVGELRLLEDDKREADEAVTEWGDKARAAARKAQELTTAGQADQAKRFEELARVALRRQIGFEQQSKTLGTQVASQSELVDKLKDGLNKLHAKYDELTQKRDELIARSKMAHAQRQVQEAVKDISVMDPTSELSRFEERVRREEAMARGMEEVSRSSMEDAFAELEDSETESEVEARLAALSQ